MLSAVLVWRIVRRLVPPRSAWVGLVAGCIFWVWPEAGLWNSTYEWGFRGVTLAAGLASVLLALRLVDRPSLPNGAVLGLSLGVLWWSSPESVYFAPSVIGLVSMAVRQRPSPRSELKHISAILLPALGGVIVGASPWLWANLHNGFASLKLSSSPSYIHSSYLGRLSLFFRETLPMMLGLKLPLSGSWIAGRFGQVVFVSAAVILAAVCLRFVPGIRATNLRAEASWCAAGVLLFPFLYAVFPATSFWEQGQYGIYLVPLMLFVVAAGAGRLGDRRRRRVWDRSVSPIRMVVAATLVGVVCLSTLASFRDNWLSRSHASLWDLSHDPNASAETAVSGLERDGVKAGYAVYWVAYDLDLLSNDQLAITDVTADRWVALYDRVRSATNQAWIFYSPNRMAAATTAFQAPFPGPDGYSEAIFVAKLQALGVGYHLVRAGVLDAVMPNHSVTQEEVGMPRPEWR